MKKGNRFIALLLSFTMLISMIPASALTALAAGNYNSTLKGSVVLEDDSGLQDVSVLVYDITDQEIVDWYYTATSGEWVCKEVNIGNEYEVVYYHPYYDFSNNYIHCTISDDTTTLDSVTAVRNNVVVIEETATDLFEYSIINGSYISIEKYLGTETEISIPSKIDDYTVQSISDEVFKNNTELVSVTIPSTIESIGSNVFYGCTNLKTVVFNAGLISLPDNTFYNCTSLVDIRLPNSIVSIGNYCFYQCTSLDAIEIPTSVGSIGTAAFKSCYELKNVTFHNGLTTIGERAFEGDTAITELDFGEGLTTIGSEAFMGCSNLKSVRFPMSLTTIGGRAFMECTALTSVVIPDSVTSIGARAFYGNPLLESVTLSKQWNTTTSYYENWEDHYGEIFANCEKLTSIQIPEGAAVVPEYAFSGCTNLTNITIASTVKTIEHHAFYNCDGITEFALPKTLETIEAYAFAECDGIVELELPNTVATIGYRAFRNCDNLERLILSAGWTTNGEYYENWEYRRDEIVNGCEKLTTITIPEGITTIPDYAFQNCTNLIEVKLPTTLNKVGNHAFYGCVELQNIVLPDGTSELGDYAFYGCTKLQNADLPDGMTKIGAHSFDGCVAITNITLPDSVSAIGYRTFANCVNLEKINIPACWIECTDIYEDWKYRRGEIFDGCVKLATITVPEGVTTLHDYAFYGCPELTEVKLPSTLKTIEKYALSGCSGLKTITLPNGLEKVAEHALDGCSGLLELEIPDSVTSMGYRAFANCASIKSVNYPAGWVESPEVYENWEYRSGYIFAGCSKLAVVIVPNSVTEIMDYAFNASSNLERVWIGENVTAIGENAFTECENLTIHGVAGTVAEKYAVANNIPFSTEIIDNYLTVVMDGKVVDKDGNGVEGVSVYIYNNTDCEKLCEINTAADGGWIYEYTYRNKEYSITYYHPNYVFSVDEQKISTGSENITVETITASLISENVETAPATDFEYTLIDDVYIEINKYIGASEIVSVPSFIDGYEVRSIADNAFNGNTTITKIYLPTELTTIGSKAFKNCSNLIEVRFPKGLTTIDSDAFMGCSNLKSVRFPMSLTTIGGRAFMECTALTSVVIPDSVTSIGARAFYGNPLLESVTLSKQWNTTTSYYENWEDHYGEIFANCEKLTSIQIPEGAAVVPEYAFSGCTNLTNITIASTVKTIEHHAFYNCDGITEFALPKTLETIEAYAFAECDGIVELELPNTVATIGYRAFRNCDNLERLILSAGWTTNGEYYENWEYRRDEIVNGCEKLTTITIPEGITTIPDYAFQNCTNLIEVKLPTTLNKVGNHAFYGCVELQNIVLPDGTSELGDYAFYGCTKLQNADLPDGMTKIGAHSFDGCVAITNITLPDSVSAIGYRTFANCVNLEKINIPACWIECTDIYEDWEYRRGEIFDGCVKLATITVPEGVTTLHDYAFYGCPELTEVKLPSTLKTIEKYALSGCSGLKTITLPNGLEKVAEHALDGCSGLLELEIPDSVTSMGYMAFANCASIKSVNYPAGWVESPEVYENWEYRSGYIFAGCSKLAVVIVPNSVTEIMDYAFNASSNLERVWIGENVTAIGENAFTECENLTIHGVAGTVAEKYAVANNIPFSTEIIDNYLTVVMDGKVVDKDGNGVEGVSVYIYNNTDCEKLCEINTAADGGWIYEYTYRNKEYSITYYHPNYVFSVDEQKISTGSENITVETITASLISENVETAPATDFEYTLIDDVYIEINKYIGASEIVSVPSFIDGYEVRSIADNAFNGNTTITKIYLPTELTTIGSKAFKNCSNLIEVRFPKGLTTIDSDAFMGCSNLKSVRFPMSLTTIGGRAFMECTALTSVVIPDSVTSIGARAFYGNPLLESVTLSKQWNTTTSYYENWEDHYGEIFANCEKLTSIQIPEGAAVVPEYAFSGCTNLTNITIASTVKTIEHHAFYNCDGITEFALPKTLETIEAYAFAECDGIVELELPNTVATIGYRAFRNCDNLERLILSAGWTTNGEYYENWEYRRDEIVNGCEKLTTITIPEGITTIPDYAFQNCTNLIEVKLPTTLNKVGNHAFYGCVELQNIVLPDGTSELGDYAFYGCTKLQNADLPDGMTKIGAHSFDGCVAITNITLPDSVSAIGYRTFANCVNLEKINIPACWIECTDIYEDWEYRRGEIFDGCVKLATITVPEGVTTLHDYAFYGCPELTEVKLPSTLKTIEKYALSGCSGLKTITLPNGLEKVAEHALDGCSGLLELEIPDSVTSMGYMAFANCASIKSVNYPAGWVESPEVYENWEYRSGCIFAGCSKLRTIEVDEGVEVIPDYAFGNSNIKSITLPNSLLKIGAYAFDNCVSLKYVNGAFALLQHIGDGAFSGCSDLRSFTIPADSTTIGSNVFSNCDVLTVFCLEHSYSAITLVDEDVPFEFIANDIVDSGELALDREGTYYVANTVGAMANGYVTMNLAYKFKSTVSDISDMSLTIRIPTELTLIEKTLMLDGVRVTGYEFENNVLTIELDNYSGQLSFCLSPQKDARVATYAVLDYRHAGDYKQEIIGVINDDIPLLSVQADSEISSNTVSVTGVGPAETDVSIYVDGVFAKTVRTNKTGSYKTSITIAEPKDYATYSISAKAVTEDGETVAYKDVKYRSSSPELTGLTMQYSAHKNQIYDLMSDSTVKPSISFEPRKDFTFNVNFTNPEQIDTVYVCSTRSNVTKRIEAVWDESTQSYVAKGLFDPSNTSYVPGTITVEYSPVRDPINFLTGNIDYTADKYVNGASEPIKAALAGKLEDCIEDLYSDDNQISGVIKLIDVDAQLDFNIMTDIIPSYLDPENAGAYGYEAIEDDLGVQLYLKVGEYAEDKVRGEIIDFAKGKITDFCIEGGYIDLDANIGNYFTFVEVLGYADTMVTWDNNRVSLTESKQAILSSNMSDEEKAAALQKLDYASKANNGVVAAMALQIILGVAGVAIPFPASMILPLLSMQNENYVDGVLGQFGFLNASETEGAEFSIRWVIDPSGYVYEGVTNNRIEGVKTTVYHIPYDDTDETFWDAPKTENAQLWDASEWDQVNPLYTDADGKYAWDVPEGWWQVKYEKEGYETTYSEWLPVPPPQTEVNIGLTSTATPTVESVEVNDGAVVITFSQYVDPETFTDIILKDADGNNIEYTVEYSKDETDIDGNVFAKVFTLNVATGTTVASIEVPETITNYAGKSVTPYDETFGGEEVLYGDVTGDGVVNNKDVTLLRRYLIGGWNVTIDSDAADVNKDGDINNKDVTLLRRYLIGGWNVTLG